MIFDKDLISGSAPNTGNGIARRECLLGVDDAAHKTLQTLKKEKFPDISINDLFMMMKDIVEDMAEKRKSGYLSMFYEGRDFGTVLYHIDKIHGAHPDATIH